MPNQWGDGELKYLLVQALADGANVLVAAVAGKRVKVISYVFTIATAAGTLILEETGGTGLAKFSVAINGGVSFAGNYDGPAFQTAIGQGLQTNNPTGLDVYGHIAYLLLDR
jgi:hypothetical protein